MLPLDEAAEASAPPGFNRIRLRRAGRSPVTTDVLFRDLWLRPALAPRDRSLVTMSALIAEARLRR